MDRITSDDLDRLAARLNKITGSPDTIGHHSKSGQWRQHLGHYMIAGAYGGWKLERTVKGGGVENTFDSGFVPRRELYKLIQAFILGLSVTTK